MKLRNIGYTAVIAATAAAFMLGSVGVGEAKGKKKPAAAPAMMMAPSNICAMPYGPVCAVRGGMKFTYNNACYAKAEGAKIVSQKACPPPKAMKAGKAKAKKDTKAKPAKK
jgi:hypothetical protein